MGSLGDGIDTPAVLAASTLEDGLPKVVGLAAKESRTINGLENDLANVGAGGCRIRGYLCAGDFNVDGVGSSSSLGNGSTVDRFPWHAAMGSLSDGIETPAVLAARTLEDGLPDVVGLVVRVLDAAKESRVVKRLENDLANLGAGGYSVRGCLCAGDFNVDGVGSSLSVGNDCIASSVRLRLSRSMRVLASRLYVQSSGQTIAMLAAVLLENPLPLGIAREESLVLAVA